MPPAQPRIFAPRGVTVDAAGNGYIAAPRNHTIRKVTASAVVTTLARPAGIQAQSDRMTKTCRATACIYSPLFARESCGRVTDCGSEAR